MLEGGEEMFTFPWRYIIHSPYDPEDQQELPNSIKIKECRLTVP